MQPRTPRAATRAAGITRRTGAITKVFVYKLHPRHARPSEVDLQPPGHEVWERDFYQPIGAYSNTFKEYRK